MQTNKICLLFLSFGLLVSCQPREKFDWEIGLSAPKYYSSIPSVGFYNNGKIVHNVSTDFGIDPGWGETSGGYASGSEPDEVPDSLVVNWDCGVDMVSYELKTKLPKQKMLQLFQNPVTDIDGIIRPYSLIIVGTAPGGNVTVWMRAVNVLTEIGKFKAKEISKYDPYDEDRVTMWTSTGKAAKENFIYLNLHGIPYSVWEKGEKEYDYDVGFTSECEDTKPLIVTFHTKEGSWYQSFAGKESESSIELFKWDDIYFLSNNNLIRKRKIPIQITLQWRAKKTNKVLFAEVVMPQNLETLMNNGYTDSITGKKEYYNRIVIGAKKESTKGIAWVTGKNKKTKLLDFILDDTEDQSIKKHIYYSLPKGFKFPKWKGREKLIQPDVEFYQEK